MHGEARVVGEKRDVCRTDVDGNERKNRQMYVRWQRTGWVALSGNSRTRTRRAERRRMGGGEKWAVRKDG